MNDLFGLGKLSNNGLEVFKTIYPDIAKPGAQKVGVALETVLDFSNTILLPLKLVNEKSKIFFQKHMETYSKKMSEIPEGEVVPVTPELGLSIMDELLKVTNDDLANLFTNLLVNASTREGAGNAHPSFINVIKSLSADEAKIIHYLGVSKADYFRFIRWDKVMNGGSIALTDEFSDLRNAVELNFKDNHIFYINNLKNLGILNSETSYLENETHIYEGLENEYSELKETYENILKESPEKGVIISISKGRNRITPFGESFIKSVVR